MTSNAHAGSVGVTPRLPRRDAQLLNALRSGVILTDTHSIVLYLNSVARDLTGWRNRMAIGVPVSEVLRLDATPGPRRRIEDVLFNADDEESKPVELTSLDGVRHPVEISISTWNGGDDEGERVIYEIRDIEASVRRTERLMHEATHDSLTGLINRREIRRRLYESIGSEESSQHVLVILDLDGFKRINDECGHLAGDKVLYDIAALLQSKMRKADSVARLGGDEFALLLIGCSLDEALHVANELCRAIREYEFHAAGSRYHVTASAGLTCVRDAEISITQIMHEADTACYRAKGAGGDGVCVHDGVVVAAQYVFEQRRWGATLSETGDAAGLVLYCQEIRALGNEPAALPKCAAQLRVRAAQGHLMGPNQFMPAALRSGIALEMDQWTLTQTLREWSVRHAGQTVPALECFVALSKASLEDSAATATFIERQLSHYAVAPGTLCLEIAERDAIANWPAAMQLIGHLRAGGVRFCLSDFGVGLYTFGYLKRTGVDYIKLPVDVVQRTPDNPFYASFMRAIVSAAQSLNMDVIGVGVQSETVLTQLKHFGVRYAQGDMLAEPVAFSTALFQDAAAAPCSEYGCQGDAR